MPALDAAGEFETIRRLFAPLAHPEWGRGLLDDVAMLPTRAGHDLVATKDAIVEGVHFMATDPLDTVAQKLLRVNLSDLAAKGAEPFGYLLACHWSSRCGWPERQAFAAGLAADQTVFGIKLLGGDTVATPGPAGRTSCSAPRSEGRVPGRAWRTCSACSAASPAPPGAPGRAPAWASAHPAARAAVRTSRRRPR